MGKFYARNWKDVRAAEWPLEHFAPSEIACKGSGEVVLDIEAGRCLDRLRRRVDRPVRLTSAYRSPEYNAKVGGSPNSYHLRGQAFDIDWSQWASLARYDLIQQAISLHFGGIGVYSLQGFIHLDIGPPRFWQG